MLFIQGNQPDLQNVLTYLKGQDYEDGRELTCGTAPWGLQCGHERGSEFYVLYVNLI